MDPTMTVSHDKVHGPEICTKPSILFKHASGVRGHDQADFAMIGISMEYKTCIVDVYLKSRTETSPLSI